MLEFRESDAFFPVTQLRWKMTYFASGATMHILIKLRASKTDCHFPLCQVHDLLHGFLSTASKCNLCCE